MSEKKLFSKEEIEELITKEETYDISKISNISSDGKSLLVRIPAEIVKYFKITKDHKLQFYVNVKTKELKCQLIK